MFRKSRAQVAEPNLPLAVLILAIAALIVGGEDMSLSQFDLSPLMGKPPEVTPVDMSCSTAETVFLNDQTEFTGKRHSNSCMLGLLVMVAVDSLISAFFWAMISGKF